MPCRVPQTIHTSSVPAECVPGDPGSQEELRHLATTEDVAETVLDHQGVV